MIQIRDLPHLDVLIFDLPEGRVIARPSGTEPKVKFYFEVREPIGAAGLAGAQHLARGRLDRIIAALLIQVDA